MKNIFFVIICPHVSDMMVWKEKNEHQTLKDLVCIKQI